MTAPGITGFGVILSSLPQQVSPEEDGVQTACSRGPRCLLCAFGSLEGVQAAEGAIAGDLFL